MKQMKKKGFWKGCKPIFVCVLANGENHLSEQPIPETCPASGTRSGQLLGFLFGLAPDGVFRASAIALGAVGSYPAFSPLPPTEAGGGLIFCGTFRRKAFRPSSRIYPPPRGRGYAASRPVEFGLSSPGLRQERFSALPKSLLIYRSGGSMASAGWPSCARLFAQKC